MVNKILVSVLLVVMGGIFSAQASTFYSKVEVSVSTGEGMVYVSTDAAVDDAAITETSHSATFSSQGAGSSSKYADHTYYLFAKGKEGYGFKQWSDGSADNPHSVTVRAESTTAGSPSTFSYTAEFAPTKLLVRSSDNSLGTVSIDKSINDTGDVVKLTAAKIKQKGNSEFGNATHAGNSIHFEGWYDGSGAFISDDMTIQYEVKDSETVEARFSREFTIKTDESGNIYGYYRLQTPYGDDNTRYFLCLTGNFQPNVSTGDRYLVGAVEFNQQPYDYNMVYSHNYAKSQAVFSDAGSIFYVTGKADMNNIKATASRTQVASGIVAYAQGTSTDYVVNGREMVLKTAATPGYYILFDKQTGASLQLNYWNHIWVSTDKPANAMMSLNGDLDIQPVDEEHIDINYFGAYPDKSMECDGGYWTSMYTSFPYECYASDGVEAYVANRVYTEDGVNNIVINRLESGIVPAATPVLLKCKGLTPKENRLIPLMPDDARLASAVAEVGENLLTGEYGLWTGGSITSNHSVFKGRKAYEETMRVFSVNGEGTLGFYKLAANADGTAQELVPNRAYLDISKLPNAANGPVRIVDSRYVDMSGIENVGVDANSGDDLIYDIYGRRVKEMTPGNIYIRNGRKILFR